MAAPADITFENWSGTSWAANQSLTGSYEEVLTLQGVSWLMRQVIAASNITIVVKQWKDNGITHLKLENRMPLGLPGITDTYVLNWEPKDLKDPVFGNIKDRARWVRAEELEEEFQKSAWGTGDADVMELFTNHVDINATTSQVCGFEVIDGERRYTRRLVVRKGEEYREMRVVFDYLGSESDKE